MTIVFQLGDTFWIETHIVARRSVAAGDHDDDFIACDKAGIFLGAMCALDANAATADGGGVTISVQQAGGAAWVMGIDITQFQVRLGNPTAGALTIGGIITILMKRTSR